MSEARDLILSRLIGFGGAVQNGVKAPLTDDTVVNALLSLDVEDPTSILEELLKEKFIVSPNCSNCESPCGSTSDYDMEKYYHCSPECLDVKNRMVDELVRIAGKLREQYPLQLEEELPEEMYRALTFLGYDLGMDSFENLLKILKKM